MARTRQLAEWLTAANPDVLLTVVRQRISPTDYQPPKLPPGTARRLQLFGCACARMVWQWLPTDARSAVLIRERFADGFATEADLRASAVRVTWGGITFHQQARDAVSADPVAAARSAAKALATRAAGGPPNGNPVAAEWHTAWNTAFATARAHQAELVRDIFPPPGHTPRLESDWRTSTVLALAQQIDETGDYSAVPILADALQDAGCDNEFMLERCRAPSGIHGRGNWVVDLVLGRE